ncbi:MAG: RhtB (resistance to homoserine/threonine) family protein [Chlamydiales bacterium]|jgi:RhtB (resistance to homoserine/threonine) family protein
METYWEELFTIATIVLLGAMSPGPDWAIVTKYSLNVSRTAGLMATLGIAVGILLHMTYCLLGVGILISQSPFLFNIIKVVGGLYLCYIGYKGLRAKAVDLKKLSASQTVTPSHWEAFKVGVVTNALNPKATLFFLSLFSLVIDPGTPLWVLLIYVAVIFIITILWFGTLSFLLSAEACRSRIVNVSHWVERGLGIILICLGVYLAILD